MTKATFDAVGPAECGHGGLPPHDIDTSDGVHGTTGKNVQDGPPQCPVPVKGKASRNGKHIKDLLPMGDIDARIASIEHKLVVLNLSLEDEKALIMELKELMRCKLRAS